MNAKIEPTYDLKNGDDLEKFILGAARDLRKREITVDEAHAISNLADKWVKVKVTNLLQNKIEKGLSINRKEVNKLLMQKTNL